MSWEFKVGMKVVCVFAGSYPEQAGTAWRGDAPIEGAVYTIKRVFLSNGVPTLHLKEIERNEQAKRIYGKDVGYRAERFRPLVSKPSSIKIFREIALGVSNGKPIIDDPMPRKKVLEEMQP
jgi:hypothetical protein